MYKKQRNALLVFFALSLMVGCKEGSTQSKPLTLPEGKANLSKGKQLTILIKNEQKKPPQYEESEDTLEGDVHIEKNLGITSTASVSKKSENIEPETSSDPPQLTTPAIELSPISEEEEDSGVVTGPTNLSPNHVARSRNPSTNPFYVDTSVIDQLKKGLGKENMKNEEFIETVSAAMANDTKSLSTDTKGLLSGLLSSGKKHEPQYTLQQVVTMCKIQRAYFSNTDFADLTDVLTEKALALLKDKDVTLLFPFNYASTAAGIVQYLGEKFNRDKFNKGYKAAVEEKLREILQALDCLVAYDSKNKSKISKAKVDALRRRFNAIVNQHSTSQGNLYPFSENSLYPNLKPTAPLLVPSRSNTVILGSILEEPELSAQETVSILDMMRDDEDLESKYSDNTAVTEGMVDKIVRIVRHLNEHKEEKLEGLDNPEDKEAMEKTLEAVNKFLKKACTTLYDEDGESTEDAINVCHNVVTREDFQKALEAAADTPTGFKKNPFTKIEGDPSNRRLRKRLIALITGCVNKGLLKAELSGTEDEAILNDIQKFEKHECFQFRLNGFKFNKKVELESDKDKVFVEVKKDEEPAGQHSRTETGTRVEVV